MGNKKCLNLSYLTVKVRNDKMLNSIKSPLVSIKASIALPKGCYSAVDEKRGTIGSTQFQDVLNIKLVITTFSFYNIFFLIRFIQIG